MQNKIDAHEFAGAKFDTTQQQNLWEIDYWYGPLNKSYELAYQMYSSEMATVASLFSDGISSYTVYCMLRDKMQVIARRAVTTFGSLGKASSENELNAVLAHVTGLLFHDCLLMVIQSSMQCSLLCWLDLSLRM